MRFGNVLLEIVNQGVNSSVTGIFWYRLGNKLCLTPLAVWRHDHTAGNLVSDHAAKALADDVQAAVKRGSGTRRGDDIAVIDVERIDIQLYVREKRLKLMFKLPVRGRAFTVENARITQHKRPQTKPDDLRPVVSGWTRLSRSVWGGRCWTCCQ